MKSNCNKFQINWRAISRDFFCTNVTNLLRSSIKQICFTQKNRNECQESNYWIIFSTFPTMLSVWREVPLNFPNCITFLFLVLPFFLPLLQHLLLVCRPPCARILGIHSHMGTRPFHCKADENLKKHILRKGLNLNTKNLNTKGSESNKFGIFKKRLRLLTSFGVTEVRIRKGWKCRFSYRFTVRRQKLDPVSSPWVSLRARKVCNCW